MILPHPESDLSLNIIVLGTDIIHLLKSRDYILVEDLMNGFLKGNKKRTPDMFLDTLTFLYTCGLIEKQNYRIRLIEKKTVQTKLF